MLCINSNFIHKSNTNKDTYTNTLKYYCFFTLAYMFRSPADHPQGYILTCGSPYMNLCCHIIKFCVHLFVQGWLKGLLCLKFLKPVKFFKHTNFVTYLERRGVHKNLCVNTNSYMD
jgi:hypothetical protein